MPKAANPARKAPEKKKRLVPTAPVVEPVMQQQAPPPPVVRRASSATQGGNPSFVLFLLLVVGFAALLFGLVRLTNPKPVAPIAISEEGNGLPDDLRSRSEFQEWLTAWRQVDPYVSRSEFRPSDERAIDVDRLAASATVPPEIDLVPPRTNRYAWSPDRKRFADFLSSYGGPDHAFTVWNRDGARKLEMLEYCGTPCRYDGAFWLDDDRLVFLSAIEALKQDGTPYCPGADVGEAVCYQRLLVTVYDFAGERMRVFRSEPHVFRIDPFEEEHATHWASGLTADEKIAAGLVEREDLTAIDGALESVADGVLILRTDDGVTTARTLPQTAYLDELGTATTSAYVRRGFRVRVTGIPEGEGKLVATAVRILMAPNVLVYAPAEGDVVGTTFDVIGVARTFEQNVRIRVRNATGKILVDTYTTATAPEVGLHGDFALRVKLPTAKLAAGQQLTLEVFESSADDGTDSNKVSITLTYQP